MEPRGDGEMRRCARGINRCANRDHPHIITQIAENCSGLAATRKLGKSSAIDMFPFARYATRNVRILQHSVFFLSMLFYFQYIIRELTLIALRSTSVELFVTDTVISNRKFNLILSLAKVWKLCYTGVICT